MILKLLTRLCTNDKISAEQIMVKYYDLIKNALWRINLREYWNIFIEDKMNNRITENKFVGLENPGTRKF